MSIKEKLQDGSILTLVTVSHKIRHMFIFDGPQMMILLILSKMLTIIMHLSSGYMLERIRNILNLMVKLQISELTLAKILSDLAKTSLNQMIFLLSIQD